MVCLQQSVAVIAYALQQAITGTLPAYQYFRVVVHVTLPQHEPVLC